MIYDSTEWKPEINKLVKNIMKYNKIIRIKYNLDKTRHLLECNILYSALIVRRLFESDKMSSIFDEFDTEITCYKPVRRIDKHHNYFDPSFYNLEEPFIKKIKYVDICNRIIHSYIFQLCLSEKPYIVVSFFVCSDRNRLQEIYEVPLERWLNYLEIAAIDDVISYESKYDSKNEDYIRDNKITDIYPMLLKYGTKEIKKKIRRAMKGKEPFILETPLSVVKANQDSHKTK